VSLGRGFTHHFVERDGAICQCYCSEDETDGIVPGGNSVSICPWLYYGSMGSHRVEALRFCDSGVLKGADDPW
jgi:hypothetical protein